MIVITSLRGHIAQAILALIGGCNGREVQESPVHRGFLQ